MERYTKDYLNYIKETKDIDMSEQYELFMKYVPKGSKILDAGFGSGRDIAFFMQYYDVTGIDLSNEFVSYVKENIHPNVYQMDILNLKFNEKFDAIWACASLVHLHLNSFKLAMENFNGCLNESGKLYISLKKYEQFLLLGDHHLNLEELLKLVTSQFELIYLGQSISNKSNQEWFSFVFQKIELLKTSTS
jgi:SAM-dependent methyltransferase